jgi:hypothetical protein
VTSTEHNNASNTTADIATTTALVVDRAPVMGGRIVLVLSQHRDSDREQDHSVRLLPPSSRDRRRLVFTLAIGDRTHLFRKDKTLRLRLRATSEREYVRWSGMNSCWSYWSVFGRWFPLLLHPWVAQGRAWGGDC